MRKVFVALGNGTVCRYFEAHGFEVVKSLHEASLVCFTGGEDVDPGLYNHSTHYTTYSNPARDEQEQSIFSVALSYGLPMVGICRGGQLLNVLNGGTMIQDVTNHGRQHLAIIEGEKMEVSSTHHQMMDPGKNAIILGFGYGTAATRTVFDAKDRTFNIIPASVRSVLDTEVLLYGNHLCIQGHPEYSLYQPTQLGRFGKKTIEMIHKHCFGGKNV